MGELEDPTKFRPIFLGINSYLRYLILGRIYCFLDVVFMTNDINSSPLRKILRDPQDDKTILSSYIAGSMLNCTPNLNSAYCQQYKKAKLFCHLMGLVKSFINNYNGK